MLSKKLKALRKEKNRSQDDVAKALGMTRARYSHIENGRNQPDNDTLVELAKYYNVTVDYLLGVENMQVLTYDDFVQIPIVGTIKAGFGGVATQEAEGYATFLTSDVQKGRDYFVLRVKGDSLIGDGIVEGDLCLIERDSEYIENQIYAVLVDGEEGTLKHVTRADGRIVLISSNPAHPPRVVPEEDVVIMGRVTQLKRNVPIK